MKQDLLATTSSSVYPIGLEASWQRLLFLNTHRDHMQERSIVTQDRRTLVANSQKTNNVYKIYIEQAIQSSVDITSISVLQLTISLFFSRLSLMYEHIISMA